MSRSSSGLPVTMVSATEPTFTDLWMVFFFWCIAAPVAFHVVLTTPPHHMCRHCSVAFDHILMNEGEGWVCPWMCSHTIHYKDTSCFSSAVTAKTTQASHKDAERTLCNSASYLLQAELKRFIAKNTNNGQLQQNSRCLDCGVPRNGCTVFWWEPCSGSDSCDKRSDLKVDSSMIQHESLKKCSVLFSLPMSNRFLKQNTLENALGFCQTIG